MGETSEVCVSESVESPPENAEGPPKSTTVPSRREERGTAAGAGYLLLGVLAVLDVHPMVLLPVAAIVLGRAQLAAGGAGTRLSQLRLDHPGLAAPRRRIADDAASASAGGEVLVGLGAIKLGILALVSVEPLVLTLVAFLAVGAAGLMGGSLLGLRLTSVFAR